MEVRSVHNGLYPKLAARSMKQNHRFFVPYLLALAVRPASASR